MALFIRFVSAMCVIGVSESYLVPNGVTRPAHQRNIPSGARETRVKVQPSVEAEQPAFSTNPFMLGMIAGLVAALVSASTPAFADAGQGQGVFDANCAGCHKGGGNVLSKEKTLTKDDLQKFSKYEVGDIKDQVAKGKASMPAFGERLSSADIDNVADYVRGKADNGW